MIYKNKYCILLLVLMLFGGYSSVAQLINPDFYNNNGNDMTAPCIAPNDVTFMPGTVGGSPGTLSGWYRTHGTPSITTDCGGNMAAVHFSALHGYSQAIAQPYEFEAGKTYTICYRLVNWDIPNSRLVFVAGENLIQYIPPTIGGCMYFAPGTTPNIGVYELMPNVVSPSPTSPADPCEDQYHASFTFTPNDNYHYFYVGLAGGDNQDYDFMVLDYVNITEECSTVPSITFDDGTSGHLPAGLHDFYKYIYAGSSYGASTAPVTNDPNAYTLFEARNAVELKHNFIANAGNSSFEARINPNLCDPAPCFVLTDSGNGDDDGEESDPPLGKGGNNYGDQANNLMNTSIEHTSSIKYSIHPNPNNGTFTIRFPKNGEYKVYVTNLLGTMVYNTEIFKQQTKVITLDSRLPSGTYIIHVEGLNAQSIQRITLTR